MSAEITLKPTSSLIFLQIKTGVFLQYFSLLEKKVQTLYFTF